DRPGPQFWAQVYALPVAIVALLVCMIVDYRTLAQRSLILYALLILALILVLRVGVTRGGAKGGIALGGAVTLQPSEFARLVLALTLAAFFGASHRSAKRWTGLV